MAIIDSLKLIGVSGESLIKYSFSFVETAAGADNDGAGVYRAAQGENLWDYAYKNGRTIDEMVKCNPDISDIAFLKEGEEVRVP